MLKISIPTPCHEDWDAMTPNAQGRHCNACVKTVVDFTSMNDEEVKYFFLHKKEEKVCGRFKTEQFHRITIELPENIFYLQLPFWKKFLAACLLVFSTTLFSCETKLQGDVVAKYIKATTSDSARTGKPLAPKLETDTANLPMLKICTDVVGFAAPSIIIDSSFAQGATIEIPVEEKRMIEVIEPVLLMDTSVINKLPLKMGEVIMAKDSVPTKNPPQADSSNCDTKTFY